MTPWTVASKGLLSMGFPREEYWSGLPFLSQGDLSDSGIKPASLALAGRFFTTEQPQKPPVKNRNSQLGAICTKTPTFGGLSRQKIAPGNSNVRGFFVCFLKTPQQFTKAVLLKEKIINALPPNRQDLLNVKA